MVSDELCDGCTSDCDSIFERTYPECKFITANYDVKVINKELKLLHLGRRVVEVLILESNSEKVSSWKQGRGQN